MVNLKFVNVYNNNFTEFSLCQNIMEILNQKNYYIAILDKIIHFDKHYQWILDLLGEKLQATAYFIVLEYHSRTFSLTSKGKMYFYNRQIWQSLLELSNHTQYHQQCEDNCVIQYTISPMKHSYQQFLPCIQTSFNTQLKIYRK